MIKKILSLSLLIVSLNSFSQYYTRFHIDSMKEATTKQHGIEHVNTMIELANAQQPFNLDTALIYTRLARKEALAHGYRWGYCKSYFIEADVIHETGDINTVKAILETCSKWFSENGYEIDAIHCDLLHTRCLNTLEGTELARKRARAILDRARKTGSVKLLGACWFEMERHKPTLLADNEYPHSLDSAIYYFNLSNDSVRMLSGAQYKLMSKVGTQEAFQYSQEAYEKCQKWGNRTGMITALWCQLYGHLVSNNLDSSIYYCQEITNVSRELGSKAQETVGLKTLAYAYSRADSIQPALECYSKSNLLNDELGWKREKCQNLSMVGNLYVRLEEYEPAAKALVETIEIAEEIDEQHTFYSAKRMLAGLYVVTEDYDRAEKAYLETLEWVDTALIDEAKKGMRANVYYDLAILYGNLEQYEMSRKYLELAIEDYNTRKLEMATDLVIVESYLAEEKEDLAITHFEEIIAFYAPHIFIDNSNYLRVKGRINTRQGKYKEAISAFEGHLELTQKGLYNEERMYTYSELSDAYRENGQFEKALSSFTIFKTIEDSLRVSDVEDNLVKIQSEYEISLKETEIKDLQQQQELSDLRLNKQSTKLKLRQLYISILVFIVIFVGVIGYLLFRRFKNKKEKDVLEMKAKRIELELENTQSKQKAELAEVKNTIFANVSHEFRTPLTLIQVPIKNQLAKANAADKVVFNSVLKNTNQLLKMVDELLDLAKIETGTVSLHKSPFHLEQFFLQVKTNFSFAFREKNIEFIVENNVSNQNFIADENRLKIVINNLLKNALSHTPNGGKVACFVRRDGDTLLIEVHNTGKTIPEHELRLIFDRHYRGRSAKYIGNGIGLSVSQQIIELHKGRIIAKNNGNEGVVFNVTIPGKFSVHEKIGRVEVKEESEIFVLDKNEIDKNKEKANKPTILIVEDNVEMMDLLQSILSSEFDLSIAMDGVEGEELALDLQPNLILSDVMMPKKDGIELLSSLKSNIITSHIPVVLLTAKADVESRISGFDQNADDYINKPFDAKELKARIFNILRQREKLQKLFTENPFLRTKDIKCTPLDAEFLEKAVTILEKHYADGDFAVIDFCKELALNRNSVHNKIKAFTNQTTSEYIKNFRLEKAIRLLVGSNNSITHVYMDVGFNSPQAFNKAFKRRFNCTPTEYRKQNSKKAI